MIILTDEQKEIVKRAAQDFYSDYVTDAITIGANSFSQGYSFIGSAAEFDSQIEERFNQCINDSRELNGTQKEEIIDAFRRCFNSRSPLTLSSRSGRFTNSKEQKEFEACRVARFIAAFSEELDSIGCKQIPEPF